MLSRRLVWSVSAGKVVANRVQIPGTRISKRKVNQSQMQLHVTLILLFPILMSFFTGLNLSFLWIEFLAFTEGTNAVDCIIRKMFADQIPATGTLHFVQI